MLRNGRYQESVILLMEEIRLTTWDVKFSVNNWVSYLSTGAGFFPSTVCIPPGK